MLRPSRLRRRRTGCCAPRLRKSGAPRWWREAFTGAPTMKATGASSTRGTRWGPANSRSWRPAARTERAERVHPPSLRCRAPKLCALPRHRPAIRGTPPRGIWFYDVMKDPYEPTLDSRSSVVRASMASGALASSDSAVSSERRACVNCPLFAYANPSR